VPRHGVPPRRYSVPRHGVTPRGYSVPRHGVSLGGTLCLGTVYRGVHAV